MHSMVLNNTIRISNRPGKGCPSQSVHPQDFLVKGLEMHYDQYATIDKVFYFVLCRVVACNTKRLSLLSHPLLLKFQSATKINENI